MATRATAANRDAWRTLGVADGQGQAGAIELEGPVADVAEIVGKRLPEREIECAEPAITRRGCARIDHWVNVTHATVSCARRDSEGRSEWSVL